jgi:hypothetical protein
MRIVAYEDRQGNFIFVKVPGEYGRFVRTRFPVAIVACPACKSAVGVPCLGQYNRYVGSIHADRAVAAHRVLSEVMPGRTGVGTEIAEDGEESPIIRDDVTAGDEEPGVEGTADNGTVDLREYFK